MADIYWISSIFLIIILSILFIKIWQDEELVENKSVCLTLMGVVALYVLMDALFVMCFLKEPKNVFVFRSIVFLFYLVYVIMPYTWHFFMKQFIGYDEKGRLSHLECIPLILLLAAVIISVPTGILWSIDDKGAYVRGGLFPLFATCNLFYYVLSFVRTVYHITSHTIHKTEYLLRSAMFSAIPLLGILINTYIIPVYDISPIQPYCLVAGSLLAALFMIEQQRDRLAREQRAELYQALQKEREASKRAIEAGRVKTTFLTNMSHDIRTPMNAILGFAKIIEKDPEDTEKVKDAVAKIQSSGDVLLGILNDILDLSKIENGSMQLEETVIDLEQTIKGLKHILRVSTENAGIDFKLQSELRNPYVWCDKTKLEQILLNILSNAVKFTGKDGHILFQVTEMTMSGGRAGYRFTVEDTGIGMTEEFQKHAFESFERERNSTESGTLGTGLGLAIVKRLVDLMGGRVELQSREGKGTTVSILLILKLAPKPETEEKKYPETSYTSLSGKRVLLAEDNALNAEIAATLLSDMGMTVEIAENGQICVDKLKESDEIYDFILMDIQMPVMDGLAAARQIRSMPEPCRDIPVIAMTANAFEEDRQNAFAAGMTGFISKPLVIDQLVAQLQEQ